MRTLAIPWAIAILSDELRKYEMDLVDLQETGWLITDKLNTKDLFKDLYQRLYGLSFIAEMRKEVKKEE